MAFATGMAATVVSASALPACRVTDVTTKNRFYADWQRTLLDTTYRLPSTYAPGDLRSTAYAGLNSGQSVRGLVISDLKAMASAARSAGRPVGRPVRLSQLLDAEVDVQLLGRRVRLLSGDQVERPRRAQRAPAGDHDRLPELRRIGALVLLGLGHDQGRGVAQDQRLEVRLRHVVPEGQDDGHLLLVRAVALPLRRAAVAAKIRASGLTVREYLWRQQTSPVPTPSPTPTPTPIASPTPSDSGTPSDSPAPSESPTPDPASTDSAAPEVTTRRQTPTPTPTPLDPTPSPTISDAPG